MYSLESENRRVLHDRLVKLEKKLEGDVISITGPISSEPIPIIRQTVESLKKKNNSEKLFVVLTTNGGDAIAAERIATILRYNYSEVHFIVPDFAYSAGTILCMSGDSIYMDYSSVLGPIDPQVQNKDGKWVPALGYLDKVQDMIRDARNNLLSQAEFLILQDFDLAELRAYEQARDLTVDLLKKWLVKYKFKNWETHRTSGDPVTIIEKEERAEEIAIALSDSSRWKSHGRPLDVSVLTELRIVIDDYSSNDELRNAIRGYYSFLIDYIRAQNFGGYIHSSLEG